MMGNKYTRKQKVKQENELNYCRCVVTVFQFVVFCQTVSSISAQGYTHSNVEAEGISQGSNAFSIHEPAVDPHNGRAYLDPKKVISSDADVIRFEPRFLDFHTQPIGIPSMRIVHIYNPSKIKPLTLNAISATTSHFHSSFFDEKVVAPNGNTTFEVVFLARVVGNAENTLFIDTVMGNFSYQVFGIGIPNPYGLRSYLGAKVSINSTFSPLIKMYNPTGIPLQITEIYTSSGYLHLQLPMGAHEADKLTWKTSHWLDSEILPSVHGYQNVLGMWRNDRYYLPEVECWDKVKISDPKVFQVKISDPRLDKRPLLTEIPPYETRSLIQASFLGQIVDNHTAFIRIKTNSTDVTQYLILPVEVEVSSSPGIYSSLELLDFGTLRTQDKPKVLSLFLLNSGSKEVMVSSITSIPENRALKIDFKPVKLKPSEAIFTRVANLSFNVGRVTSEEQWSGKIMVQTKEKSYAKLFISYQANVLNGTLGYDDLSTYFRISQNGSSVILTHNISLTNTFAFPVVLHKLDLADDSDTFYKIVNFISPCTIPDNKTVTCFAVQCVSDAFRSAGTSRTNPFDSTHFVILHTNASTFSLPLQTYTGLLTIKSQSKTQHDDHSNSLDFGIMGTLDKRQLILTLYNHNPLPVSILGCNSSVKGVEINMISLKKDDDEEIQPVVNVKPLFRNITLPAESYMTLEVILSAPKSESLVEGVLNIFTTFEKIEILLKGKTAIGTLSVKPPFFKFRSSFPGNTVHQTVSIMSSFAQAANIEAITSSDKRFYYRKLKNVGTELDPGKDTKVGKVYFDARQECKPDRCYVGLPTTTTVGHHWLTTLNLGKESPEIDLKLYNTLRERWKYIEDNNMTSINATFRITSSLVQNLEVAASASLYWPTFLEESNFLFPLTHLGKTSTSQLTIYNPSDVPVILQILPISIYPQPLVALDALRWTNLLQDDTFFLNNTHIFSVFVTSNSSAQETSSQMMWLDYTLNGKINRSCINVFLNPGQRQSIDVTFTPQQDVKVSTIILLRNNLTVLGALRVEGRGVREELKVGGKLSNSPNVSLRFKLTEPLLRDCDAKSRKESPNFTVRKSFTAKNTGLLPLHVLYMMIDNYHCEGYGFRILDCVSFLLQPNATRDIMIAYTPDFTRSTVLHTLRIYTSQGSVLSYSLNVSLPHHLLPACHAAIPRPYWEYYLYHVVIISVSSAFIGVVMCAYLEAMDVTGPLLKGRTDGRAKALSPMKKRRFNLPDVAKAFDSATITRRCGRFLRRFKTASCNMISFDLLHLFRGWKFASLRHRAVEKLSDDDPENVYDSSKKVPVINKNPVNPVTVGQRANPVVSKTRQRQNGRKSKSNGNSRYSNWKTNQGKNSSKTNIPEKKAEETIEDHSQWLPSEVPPKPDKKLILTEPELPKESSGSSIESSRSRENSISSGISESDKGGKRKRKNKPNRQPSSIIRDIDDSSSTTTEKSNEDFDEKQPCFEDIWKKDRKKYNVTSDTIIEQNMELPYANDHVQAVRRRLDRLNTIETRSKSYVTSLRSSSNMSQEYRKPTTPTIQSFCDTSGTDESLWEISKSKNTDEDADEEMRAIAEETKRNDKRMRVKMPPRSKRTSSSSSSSSVYSSVVSSSNETPDNQITASRPNLLTKKPNLLKAQSMPEAYPIFAPDNKRSTENPLNRRRSNNESSFSMFTASGRNNGNTYPPPLNVASNYAPWDNWGQNSFSIAEGVIPRPAISQAADPPFSSSHWEPYPALIFSTSPVPTSDWAKSQVDFSPHSATTPRLSLMQNEPMNPFNSSPSPASRSTHAIWSVSNAVTMDEDRSTPESDPLGVKSIWSSNTNLDAGRRDLF